ncbi:MAG: glycoside hydrolase family 15 protein [Candidatus Sericytochromatia bacterium]
MRASIVLSSFAVILGLLACQSTPRPLSGAAQPGARPTTNVTGLREPLSAIMGDAPNFAASSNGDLLTAVSSPIGRGAKAGALVEMYWPNMGDDHLWDAYSGVRYEGKFYWLHQFKLAGQEVQPDSDIVITRFTSPDGRLEVATHDMVQKERPVHVRLVRLTNRSNQPLRDLSVTFYSYLTANLLPQGDHCQYLPDQGAVHHYEGQAHFVVGLDRAPAQFQCGGVKQLITNATDAMHDAEDGQLKGNSKASALIGLGVNEALATAPFDLAPGETRQERALIGAGKDLNSALSVLNQARQQAPEAQTQANLTYWKQHLDGARYPAGMDAREQAVYRRALIVMKQHSALSGAHLAAPTSTSPPYRFSWPRDGSFIALAELQTGHPEDSRRFLEFMAKGQKPNGSWAINYRTDGASFYDFGDRQNEHDQVGTIPWMMVEYAHTTGDWAWLQRQWPVIQKACEYLLRNTDATTGLLGPTRDLWELSTTDTWTYSNAAGYAGFMAGAEAARRAGDAAAAGRYTQAAERIKQGISTYLWEPQGNYFARGYNLNSRRRDPKVEAANLALVYPFKVFEANDPRMLQMAAKIQGDLSSPAGGIRRYTGDKYYDGQPWPVTTDWLAIYYSLAGRPDLAARLHTVNTGYAYRTGSLQLGEQFDEAKGIWVSATPLTWSAAKYVLSAWALPR